MTVIAWWNVGNLFDDHDDPHTKDRQRTRREYLRDVEEISSVLAALEPSPLLIGLGEVENKAVLDELCTEMRWHPKRRDFICSEHVGSRDIRGIDVGFIQQSTCIIDRVEALYPSHAAAVRPVILLTLRVYGQPLRITFVHSKSRRSGPSHRSDARAGSAIRFAYGRLVRSLAVDAGADGVGFIAMGDWNDEPTDQSLVAGAQAHIGRPQTVNKNRLYNLTLEAAVDSPGTHCHYGTWAMLDQVLVNGLLLAGGPLTVHGRPLIITAPPLLYKGVPNRWYSDHLPLALAIQPR